MYNNKPFTKDMILWQCTLVKFRNGMRGIAVNDKTSETDNDGDEVFMIYDPSSKMFVGAERLVCYDNNLCNTLSLKGVLNKIGDIETGKRPEEVLHNDAKVSDSDWDVIGVNVYPYALDAFKVLTKDKIPCGSYQINK